MSKELSPEIIQKVMFGAGISHEDRKTKFGRFHIALPEDPTLQLDTALPLAWKEIDLANTEVRDRPNAPKSDESVTMLGLYTPDPKTCTPRMMAYIIGTPLSLKQVIAKNIQGILDLKMEDVNGASVAHVLAYNDREKYTRTYLEVLPRHRIIVFMGTTDRVEDLATLGLICTASGIGPKK